MVAKIVQNKGGKSSARQRARIFLRKTKEENPLLLQRQSHFAPQNKED